MVFRVGLALLLSCCAIPVAAVDYPTKPVRLVVVYPPGGGIDLLARVMGQQFTESWGQQIVIDNRPGAGTTIGAAVVAKAPPDGYTLLFTDVSFAITPSLYATLPYDAQKSFAPISLVNLVTDVLVVHPSLPATNVKELVAYAKANPGKVLYASAGNGTLNHLAPEMLKSMAGIDLVHVPFKGAVAALIDVVSGRQQVYIGALVSTVPQIKAGRVRAIAITGQEALGAAARSADCRRIRFAGLRRERMVWITRARRHAAADHPGRATAGQESPAVAGGPATACGAGQRSRGRHARAVQRVHCKRDQEVGRGGQGCRREGRLAA